MDCMSAVNILFGVCCLDHAVCVVSHSLQSNPHNVLMVQSKTVCTKRIFFLNSHSIISHHSLLILSLTPLSYPSSLTSPLSSLIISLISSYIYLTKHVQLFYSKPLPNRCLFLNPRIQANFSVPTRPLPCSTLPALPAAARVNSTPWSYPRS